MTAGLPIKMLKQHATSNSSLPSVKIYSSKGCWKTSQRWIICMYLANTAVLNIRIFSRSYQFIGYRFLLYVLDPFHLQRANKLYRKYKPVRITQKEYRLIWISETSQKLNIYLYNYQIETAIFIASKHEKTIMVCSF